MKPHETAVGETVEWYTPPELFDRIGLRFDLDPACPIDKPEWLPADRWFSEHGETQRWEGRVWLNPPYGAALPAFVSRMVEHRDGMMLSASRTESRWWQSAASSSDALCFLRERLYFIRGDGFRNRSTHGSTLFAWGADCVLALRRANLGWMP